jgi:hypothetical protein
LGSGEAELLLFYFGFCGLGDRYIWTQIGVFADEAIRLAFVGNEPVASVSPMARYLSNALVA